jgi:hypothetical protein
VNVGVQGADFLPKRVCKRLVEYLQHGHFDTQCPYGCGGLGADEPGAHDHDVLAAGQLAAQPVRVGQSAQVTQPFVLAGQGPRPAAGGQQQPGIPQPVPTGEHDGV